MSKSETGGPDEERIPVVPFLEQVRFLEIVQRETTAQGRRMIDWWVCPHDVQPGADDFLDRTFELLWRTNERQEESNG